MIQEEKNPKSQRDDKNEKDSSLKIVHSRASLLKSEEIHTQPCILTHSHAYQAKSFPCIFAWLCVFPVVILHGWPYVEALPYIFFFFQCRLTFFVSSF